MLLTAGIKDLKGKSIIAENQGLFSLEEMAGFDKGKTLYAFGAIKTLGSYFVSQSPIVSDVSADTSQRQSPGTLETLFHRFVEASLKVKILVVILVYLVVSILVLFISILINRYLKTRQRQRRKELKDEYQEQLASFLFDDEVEKIEFRGINKKLNREIFIDELMDLHNNLHGEVADKLKDLYFNLGLHKDSLNKLYKGKWYQKTKGFGELAQMDVKDANEKIVQYTNSKHPVLRMEAQVAMVKLAEERPLSFLDNLESELSYWEQINIYDTLIYHQITIDSFEEWIDNPNPSVVVFCLRMIALFKHVHSGARVRELLFHDNPEISLAAVQAMKSLEIPEYVNDLKMLYRSETLQLVNILETQRKNKTEKEIRSLDDLIPRKIRYEIVKSLRPIATNDDVPFLEQVVMEPENSYKIRILAITILSSLKPAGEKCINEMLNGDNELVKKMINNVKQTQES
ncbi:MAG: hypothetical protein EA361_06800 [Bacteroidetes bacterium]|nr:MAG: hypothetical protein EA361_06800 [Bacteroidota bacterium]